MVKMTNFITGLELIERWGIKDFELLDYVKKGLQPYNGYGNPFPPPDYFYKTSILNQLRNHMLLLETMYSPDGLRQMQDNNPDGGYSFESLCRRGYPSIEKEFKKLKKELDRIENPYSWENVTLSESDFDQANTIIDYLQRVNFNLHDIEEIERNKNTNHIQQSPENMINIQEKIIKSEQPLGENYFLRKGTSWEIRFKGDCGYFPDRKGIQYVVRLLEKPLVSIPAVCLASNDPAGGLISKEAALSQGLNIEVHGKKPQNAVRKAINSFLINLKKNGMKNLADHLKKNILTGKQYDFYYHDQTIKWIIRE
jgi:hypothetical protein